MKGVFDTNVVVDYLAGEPRAASTLSSYTDRIVSRISWMELLVGATDAASETRVRTVLSRFRIAEVTVPVSEAAVRIRRMTPKVKLPDAIIYATAKEEGCGLITRDTAAFSSTAPDVIVPYTI
jgi:predicted nucleic acid-binding protein